MSVCFLINGFRNIGTIYFQKELDFRKEFILNFVSALADIVLSIALIFIWRSIWGVIAARVVTVAVNCAGSFLLSRYRPRFSFVTEKARGLWGFGKWIYGLNILGYCLEMGDTFFVWFYLGLPGLALYRYAFNFANMPSTHLTQVFSTVSFPAYSKIQDDLPRLREAFLKIFSVTVFIACPVSFLLFMLGPDFIRLFLKPDLHPMTPAFQILVINGFISAIGSTVVLKALNCRMLSFI
jgi:lipopolysaccharide exporter